MKLIRMLIAVEVLVLLAAGCTSIRQAGSDRPKDEAAEQESGYVAMPPPGTLITLWP